MYNCSAAKPGKEHVEESDEAAATLEDEGVTNSVRPSHEPTVPVTFTKYAYVLGKRNKVTLLKPKKYIVRSIEDGDEEHEDDSAEEDTVTDDDAFAVIDLRRDGSKGPSENDNNQTNQNTVYFKRR